MPMPDGMQQQFCLKWNNHQVNLLKVFGRLFASEHFTDVVLAAEGRSIKAHRVVLSACSAYFEQLLSDNCDRGGCPIIILKDVSFFDLSSIVEFMYKGEINVTQEKLGALLKTAENLKVKGLAEVSEDPQEPSSSQQSSTAISAPVNNTAQAMPQINPEFATHVLFQGIIQSAPTESLRHSAFQKEKGSTETIRFPEDSPSPGPVPKHDQLPLRPDYPDTVLPPCPQPVFNRLATLPAPSSASPTSATAPAPDSALAQATLGLMKEESPADGETTESPVLVNGEDLKEPTAKLKTNKDIVFEGGHAFYCGMLVVKLNTYLQHGTRAEFWEELVTRKIMDSVRNKALDMKTGADLLGVSYGTLYGRYRETFGYLKHAWTSKKKENKEVSTIKATTPVPALAATEIVTIDRRILDALLRKDLTLGQASAMLGLSEMEIYSRVEHHLKSIRAQAVAQEADDRSSDGEGRLRIDSDESSQEVVPQDLKLKARSVETVISSRID